MNGFAHLNDLQLVDSECYCESTVYGGLFGIGITGFANIIVICAKTFLPVIKYSIFDELHENNTGLTIDVVDGRMKGVGKLYNRHLFLSNLNFPAILSLQQIKMRLRFCLCAMTSDVSKLFV